MGIISELMTGQKVLDHPADRPQERFRAVERGRDLYRQIFGINKEDSRGRQFPQVNEGHPTVPGGSWGRGIAETGAIRRLVQALRSRAPGGWSDDRYEESRHWTDVRYICGHRTGEQLLQSEFQVFRKDRKHPDGKRPVTEDDPPEGNRWVKPYDLVKLLEKPNNDDSWGDYMYAQNQQLDMTGTALTYMVPNRFGIPMELYPIPTALAIPQPAINPDYPDGYYRIQPLYPYGPFSSYPTPSSAVGAPIPAQWMIRVKYTHPLLRYDGYSPQTGLRLHLDEIEQMDRSRWYMMKRLINPSAVLNFDEMESMQPLPWEEIERIKAEFENDFQGSENAGRLLVATPGAKLEPWNSVLKDLEFKDGWDQLVGFAMAGLGISKEAAGMIGTTSYAVLYAALKQLNLLTLKPKCHRIASKLTRDLAPFFGDDLIIEIRPPKIDDHELEMSKANGIAQNRAGTINEYRKIIGLPISHEKWGEERLGSGPQPEGASMLENGGQGMSTPASQQLMAPNGMRPANPQGVPPGPPAQAPELQQAQPGPGPLGRGALGPRKSLDTGQSLLSTNRERYATMPVVHVNVPETAPPVVNIHVPRQAPPTVNVNVPKPPRYRKRISYNPAGQPVEIIEEEDTKGILNGVS
ncbi:MAG: phage portal protein [Patescibacteria group bacterium]|nr:phage portal protein [Patescibacteria group bacterium]